MKKSSRENQPAKRKGEPISPPGPDFPENRAAQIRQLVPEAVTEGKIDFEKLRAALGDEIDERPERFSFTWAGKRNAILELQKPTWGTLVPAKNESINFDTTQNVFIEGENLEVLKLLYKSYFGRVKLIYIDPPYNTGNDFVYPDDFADPKEAYLKLTGQKDAEGNLLTSNPETGGRYHSAWLSMMYPRLFLARQLLRDDGVIFVSIDDHEVHNLRLLMNEIFGEENFVATVIWQKVFAPKNTARHLSEDHDYVVIYARNKAEWIPTLLPRTDEVNSRYENLDKDPRGVWSSSDLTARNYYSEGQYEVVSPTGRKFHPSVGNYWRVKKAKFQELDADKRVWWGEHGDSMPRLKRFLTEVKQGLVPQTLWTFDEVGHTQEAKKELVEFVKFENTDNVFDTVKPTRLLQQVLKLATTPKAEDLIVDFFGGSGATGHAVWKQNCADEAGAGNRRFVLVQIPEPLPAPEKRLKTIADICRSRLSSVSNKLKAQSQPELPIRGRGSFSDFGFASFKLVPSAFKPWPGADGSKPDDYARTVELFADPLADGWKPEPVIYEVALREGYSLTSRLEKLPAIKGNTVWRVSDPDKGQSFRICLDDELKAATVRALELAKDDLFICRDCALDDKLAANLALQCRLKTI